MRRFVRPDNSIINSNASLLQFAIHASSIDIAQRSQALPTCRSTRRGQARPVLPLFLPLPLPRVFVVRARTRRTHVRKRIPILSSGYLAGLFFNGCCPSSVQKLSPSSARRSLATRGHNNYRGTTIQLQSSISRAHLAERVTNIVVPEENVKSTRSLVLFVRERLNFVLSTSAGYRL